MKTFPLFVFLLIVSVGCASPASTTPVVNAVSQENGPQTVGESTKTPAPTMETETIYPYYLPMATKPDVPSQTIKDVTASIDWAYADESGSRCTTRSQA